MKRIVLIAMLLDSMLQGVFAQKIAIKGSVKDAASKEAVEYVNVVLQASDSTFIKGTTINGKGNPSGEFQLMWPILLRKWI